MIKFYYNNIELNLLNSTFLTFSKLYGCSTILSNILYKRFELVKTHVFLKNQIVWIYLFLTQLLPNVVSIKMVYLYNLLLLDKSLSYQTFRHLFNLPVNGQRTWGGGKSIRLVQSELYKYKFKKYNKFTNNNNILYMAELINLLWKIQYNYEWRYSVKYFTKLPWYIQKKKKCIGVTAMANKRIDSFFKWKFVLAKKPKSNRRKKIINKNLLTSGFTIGFTLLNKRNFI